MVLEEVSQLPQYKLTMGLIATKHSDEKYAQQLAEEYQKAWRRADDEDKKFLKPLKVGAEDIARIVARATAIDATDDWEPKMEE